MSCPDCEPRPKGNQRRYGWLIGLALLAGGLVALAAASPAHDEAGMAVSGLVKVEVNDRGFSPSSITLEPGPAVDLEFLRTTDETCADSVAFPELGISERLALNQPVRIRVPANQRRTLSFQCGVGDHRSAVIIN
jgi:plastocyanin domain-containing protein